MLGFIQREYVDGQGPFYEGENSSRCFSARDAEKWFSENRNYFQEVSVIMPPQEEVSFRIPVKPKGEEDFRFEEIVLTSNKIDPKVRIIINNLLKLYKFCKGGFFVKREDGYHDKMHTKNMDVLQLMKDVMLGFIRYEDLELEYVTGKGRDRKVKKHKRDICQDIKGATYYVNGRKHTTDLYGVYTRNLRQGMLLRHKKGVPENLFDFYGGHELQYRQRKYELESGDVNYVCASKKSGKTFLGEWLLFKHSFKSPTTKSQISDPALLHSHFFVPKKAVIPNYIEKMKGFIHNFLVGKYGLPKEIANQIVEWRSSDNLFNIQEANGVRSINIISEQGTVPLGMRSIFGLLDEANYMNNYQEISDFIVGAGAKGIMNISTISTDSRKTKFYQARANAVVETKKLKPIDEVIHYLRKKYGFDKITSREDYQKMIKDDVFAKVEAEYYTMRPVYATKVTLDDLETESEEARKGRVRQAITQSGYDAMLAELYCELPSEKPAINYKPNIIEHSEVPMIFDRIYAGYDEADSYDKPALCVIGLRNKKLYVIHAEELPLEIGERFNTINETLMSYQENTLSDITMVMDMGRGAGYYREAIMKTPYLHMGIKARSGMEEKIGTDAGIGYYFVGEDVLVGSVMEIELLRADKIFFSDNLSNDGGLFDQLDNYIRYDNGKYKGKGRNKDDLVSAMLYCAYYAYKEGLDKTYSGSGKDRLTTASEMFDMIVNEKKIERQQPRVVKSLRARW